MPFREPPPAPPPAAPPADLPPGAGLYPRTFTATHPDPGRVVEYVRAQLAAWMQVYQVPADAVRSVEPTQSNLLVPVSGDGPRLAGAPLAMVPVYTYTVLVMVRLPWDHPAWQPEPPPSAAPDPPAPADDPDVATRDRMAALARALKGDAP